MKLFPLLLCLLLCGCAPKSTPEEPDLPPATTAAVVETAPVSMYAPEHPMELSTQGALRVYPLTTRKTHGMIAFGEDLLLFSGYGNTTLTCLTGTDLHIRASTVLGFDLSSADPSVRIHENALSYYDPARWQTVVLNTSLEPVQHIVLTESILGSPILSADQTTLFYCTSDAVRAWNLESNIHRTVTELSYDEQSMTGLHLNDTVLQCRIRDGGRIRTLFLDAATGQLLSQQEGDVWLQTNGEQYYTILPDGSVDQLIFGETSGLPRILYPQNPATGNFFLPKNHAAVTASLTSDEEIQLSCYDLGTGTIFSQLTLPPLQSPRSILAGNGKDTVCLLVYDPANDCDTIYLWDTGAAVFRADSADGMVYTEDYASTDPLSQESLLQCQEYAASLSQLYGLQVLILEDAAAVQPWDYRFEAETNLRVLQQELALLDQRLSRYPQTVLDKTASHFASLKLCLVHQITGTTPEASLSNATGVQFLEDGNAYVVIAAGKYSEQALYHELFHVMETHILNKSSALDQWNALNPEGFTYSLDYAENSGFDSFLSGENRAFVDAYSMSYPKEDRARIFENAMLPGNQALFTSAAMQAKLTALCQGIRQAYGLRKAQEAFPWEQYLEVPLFAS